MRKTITISKPIPLPDLEIDGITYGFQHVTDISEIPEGTTVHCVTTLDHFGAQEINRLPASIKLIASMGVGTDHIDLNAAEKKNITVSNTPVVTEDTADLAFALILAGSRKVAQGEQFLSRGLWSAGETAELGFRVHGKHLGIIGFGNIGQAVARRAAGFGMKVSYWNRTRKQNIEDELQVSWIESLETLMAECDIVSIHTALTDSTHHLVNTEILSKAKQGMVLVNTSRGKVIDEAALINALENGHISVAALDVFENEPIVNPSLLNRQDVLLTPHIGSATVECRSDMFNRLVSNVRQFLSSGSVLDLVTHG